MFTFVLGLLSELARETGDRLDRVLPAPRLRRSLRHWRRTRPFWAAAWVIAGGVEMVALPLAPLPLMIKVGVGAMSAVGISLVLIAGGLFFLFRPEQRMFVSVVTAIASLTSMATTNLGGFGIGMAAGLIGSSMAFGWLPDPVPEGEDAPGGDGDRAHGPRRAPVREAGATGAERTAPGTARTGAGHDPGGADRAAGADGAARATGAPGPAGVPDGTPSSGRGAAARDGGRSKEGGDRARSSFRRRSARGAVLAVTSVVLVAAAVPAAVPAPAARGSDGFPSPWPTFEWHWPWEPPDVPTAPGPSEGSSPTPGGSGPTSTPSAGSPSGRSAAADDEPSGGTPSGSGEESGKGGGARGAQVTLPCLTGIDTGGLPGPGPEPEDAVPGEVAEDPGDLTALRPPIVVGDRPGRPRATYPISPGHPEVRADTLTAYGAIIHGATHLPTVDGGRLKVLWVHADRLVADDYSFRLKAGGQVQTIDVDLDIPQVDIYVTRLTGSITIPFLDVRTPRVCVGADIVPANLPVAVRLPELSVAAVEAGQVLVDAETVDFSDLTVRSGNR
ncbi:DUF6114 domain-containing protein [Streptomyces fructofermentans]|uniref:Integral membrane protein n=1 Tax=Streptomyces fructofermentans TaxID=152141 RepID=A0A918KUJ5_9ACTN|nr:DUF6114 domain-containing protein [Streptomyces fructofermentans]GGX76791.1 hypothetical protein GCM10010515_50980 [Streptomyces fructofermentans]